MRPSPNDTAPGPLRGAAPEASAGPRGLLPYLAVLAGLVAVYAPVLRSPALFNDDYGALYDPPPIEWIIGAAGRPVQYLVLLVAHRLLALTPGDALAFRAAGFVLWAALALGLVAAVRRGLGAWGAAALVLFVFSVPAWLINFGWASMATVLPGFLAALASYATGYLLLGTARSRAARVALGVATVLLVAAATLTYQICAGLPVALVVYHLLFERDRGAPVRRAVVSYALTGAGLVLALVVLKVVLRLTGIPIADRAQGTLARLASLKGLLMPLRIFDANFGLHYYWWGWLTREAAVLLGVALSILVIRVAWREARGPGPDARERRARWLLALAGLAGAGMLFALDASRELRSKPFLTLLVLFLAVYALRETRAWARLPGRPALVGLVVVLTAWSGRSTLADGLLVYTELELAEVKGALARTAPGTLRHVHVVQPKNRCYTPPCYGWFEFNQKLASEHPWVPVSLVRYALAQLGRAGESPQVTFSRRPPEDPSAAVVDLDALGRRLYAERGETLDLDQFRKRKDLRLADVAGLSGCWLRIAPRPEAAVAPQGGGVRAAGERP